LFQKEEIYDRRSEAYIDREGYTVLDSVYISNKIPMKITCPDGHELEIKLNNFLNNRRCALCNRKKAIEERRQKLIVVQTPEYCEPQYNEVHRRNDKIAKVSSPTKPEWLEKLDEMRKNLKLGKRRTYRE